MASAGHPKLTIQPNASDSETTKESVQSSCTLVQIVAALTVCPRAQMGPPEKSV